MKKITYISPGNSDNQYFSTSNEAATSYNPDISTSNESATTYNPDISTSNESATTYNQNFSTSNESATTYNQDISTSNESATTYNPDISTSNESATTYNPDYSTSNKASVSYKKNFLKAFNSYIIFNKFKGKGTNGAGIFREILISILILFRGSEININKKHIVTKRNLHNPEIKKFINDADEYLHYANGIMFFICNFRNASEIISIRIYNAADRLRVLLIICDKAKASARRTYYFIFKAERANAFEGVIERYCGVPP